MVVLQGILILLVLYTLAVLLLGMAITAGIVVFHVAMVPLMFKYSKIFRRAIVFANFVQWPYYVDFEEPSNCGINGARNLSIEYHSKVDKCKIKLGIWHVLPKTSFERLKGHFEPDMDRERLNTLLDEELVASGKPIMLYCHGNANSRGATHRIELYKYFQKMDFHTIAFDYRGYGDSTNIPPTEHGVVEDSLIVYEWVHSNLEAGSSCSVKPSVFVWGHSLGTGISSHLLGNLDILSKRVLDRSTPLPLPKGLILEAPFNCLADEVKHHPLARLIRWLPYYDWTCLEPFRNQPEHIFRSEAHLAKIPDLPIIILHAYDDHVVPIIVGKKLYRSLRASRAKGGASVRMHTYDSSQNYGHTWICLAKDLHTVIGNFVRTCR